jgi:nitroreductase
MEFLDVVFNRKTTNGPFLPDKVSEEHQQLLMKVASAAPSQFNSQPWRFVLIDERETINRIADISGASMTKVMAEGTFFERYKKYFRFSRQEMDQQRSGMLFDRLPPLLRPFTKRVFTPSGQSLMNTLRVPRTLGEENRKLVAGSPLLVGVLLDRAEYRPGQLSAFYSVFSMGAAMENLWLATVELGMGIQFVSFPMEVPENWKQVAELLEVPDDLELMAVYRLGYVPETQGRPAIDWSSRERKRPSQYVFRGTCATPQSGWDETNSPSTRLQAAASQSLEGRRAQGGITGLT